MSNYAFAFVKGSGTNISSTKQWPYITWKCGHLLYWIAYILLLFLCIFRLVTHRYHTQAVYLPSTVRKQIDSHLKQKVISCSGQLNTNNISPCVWDELNDGVMLCISTRRVLRTSILDARKEWEPSCIKHRHFLCNCLCTNYMHALLLPLS